MEGILLRRSLSLIDAPEILDPLLASTKTVNPNTTAGTAEDDPLLASTKTVNPNTTAGTAEDFQFTPLCTFQWKKGTINPNQGSYVKPGRSCPLGWCISLIVLGEGRTDRDKKMSLSLSPWG